MKLQFYIFMVFLNWLSVATLTAQSIHAALLPFNGITSVYETDTMHYNIESFNLLSPGQAQIWTFTAMLNRTGADTVRYNDLRPDSIENANLMFTQTFSNDSDTPVTQLYFVDDDHFLLTGLSIPCVTDGIERLNNAIIVHPIPLSVSDAWQTEIRIISTESSVCQILESVHAEAAGSLILPSGTYFTIRLQIRQTQIMTIGNDRKIAERIIYRWIAPYIGSVLEIESFNSETDLQFRDAAKIRRLITTNVEAFGCDPSCDPQLLSVVANTLNCNHPNPFNSQTRITYTLPFRSEITWTIYNNLGQILVKWVESKPAGNHEMIWSGTDKQNRALPSGIYLYRLDAHPNDGQNPFSQTKRMILVR